MSDNITRYCRNCGCELMSTNKHKICENCRRKRFEKVITGLKAAAGVGTAVLSIGAVFINKGGKGSKGD